MSEKTLQHVDLLVIGGGAAGYFGAITAAQARPGFRVLIAERGSQPLAKVRVSGGGRCNVTHACFEPRPLSTRYPRGARALLSAFSRFQPADTVRWFEQRGVQLKTEADGRMFPTTDASETIIACLQREATAAGVELRLRCSIETIEPAPDGSWRATISGASPYVIQAKRILLATGGWRDGSLARAIQAAGHDVLAPVPSLFTFHIEEPWVRSLAGLAVPQVEVSVSGTKLRETGPVLFTHWGLSGPAILRISAWGARDLAENDYQFNLRLKWSPSNNPETVAQAIQQQRETQPGKAVENTPLFQIPARLWEQLVAEAGIETGERWNQLPRTKALELGALLLQTELPVSGKSMHKDEFVTCGGISLKQIDFKTMESRLSRGLYFAGEVIDVDGVTGGFNFQAAWTTGWLAGHAIAESSAQ
ncbi:MAG: NAD(P)/FAD-dependent oxidoreductase [Verrucomicrobiota bacterium]